MKKLLCLLLPAVIALVGSLPLRAADTQPPEIESVNPPAGTVGVLTNITIRFTEPVVGVEAYDLLLNGQPALVLTGASNTYTFGFSPLPPGPVQVIFDVDHGITDAAGNPFDDTAPGSIWFYDLFDAVPPALLSRTPPPGATVRFLTQLEVEFTEPVAGVDAADLRVSGQPASSVVTLGPTAYRFAFPEPAGGTVTFSWANEHGIRDLANPANALVGESWTVHLAPTAAFGGVVIHEFLADNLTGLRDEDGEVSDWIELRNTGASMVNLTGWGLTDETNAPGKWTFPATNLNPGQYLFVFASGKDRKPARAGATNHTNFRLPASGSYLGLFSAESPRQVISELAPAFPEQRAHVSYGLRTNGAWAYFSVTTPGAANSETSAVSGVTLPPHASVPSGLFNQPFNVVLSCPTPGASLYYSLDGSPPTTNSLPYTGPISVAGTSNRAVILLRAAAFTPGLLPSTLLTRTYIFPDQVLTQPARPAGFPAIWDSPCSAGVNCSDTSGDYEMDPQVLTNTAAGYRELARAGLMAIPSVSIVTHSNLLFGPAQGVYVRREDWNQQPVNVEMLRPDGREGFNVLAGLEIQGGTSPNDQGGDWKSKKLSLRLIFRGDFGSTKLRYPLFPDSPVEEFDTLILDAGLNYVWSYNGGSSPDDQRQRAQYVRDQFVSDLQRILSGVGPHGRFVHVYLNGLYWGLYNLHERPDDAYSASYFGGDKSEYDVLKHNSSTVVAGNATSYNALFTLARSRPTNDAVYRALQQQLDVPWFIDYMIINLWAGNTDWAHQNWYASKRRGADGRWRYHSWDAEHVLKSATEDKIALNNAGGPTELFQLLRLNPEFRLKFADHVHRHFFNGGPFFTDTNAPVWNPARPDRNVPASTYMRRIAEIDPAIVAESARWGDVGATGTSRANNPCTRNNEWMKELNALLGKTNTSGYTWNFFPTRMNTMLTQFRNAALYPANRPPTFSQHGGPVPAGYSLFMTNVSAGTTIYYTTNGVDPRVYGTGAVAPDAQIYTNSVPVPLLESLVVKARSRQGTNWSALNEAVFTVAELGLPLRMTELMYNPLGGDGFEFIELKNVGRTALNLGGYFFDGIAFTFPPGTTLAPGALLVLAASTNVAVRYPGLVIGGYFGGRLDNGGERIALRDAVGNIILSVDYDDANGWPTAADGAGASLEILDPNGDPDDPANWRASAALHGTPGFVSTAPALGPVILSEVMADNVTAVTNAGTFPDWIELQNISDAPVNVSGWSLSDNGEPRRFVFPPNTSIPAGQFLVVWCDATTNTTPGFHTGFALSRAGDQVFLCDAAQRRVDAIQFGAQLADYSMGRVTDEWNLNVPTPGATNEPALLASETNLVINEWLANAPPGASDWIELFNRAVNRPAALRGLHLGNSNVVARLHALSFLAPQSHALWFADEQPGSQHVDFRLPAAGGAITLHDAAGQLLDRVAYGTQAEGMTEGRLPDGAATVVTFPGSPSPAAPNYQIRYTGPVLNEVMAANVRAVTNSLGQIADWIEVFNAGTNAVDLTGWSVSLDQPERGQWYFPTGLVLAAQAYLVIWCDGAFPASTRAQTHWLNTGHGIDRDSGAAYLINPTGQWVDAIEFGFQVDDLSIGREQGRWKLLAAPTPGAFNAGPAPLGPPAALRINEWFGALPGGDDWFELFNPGALPVELSNLYLTDDPSIPGMTNHVVAPLSYIGAGSFVKWKADGNPAQGRNHVNFRLNQFGETIRLYTTNLVMIDAIDFGLLTPGTSQGRYPDGQTNFAMFRHSPTPGFRNSLTPEITRQPRSQFALVGGRAVFQVEVNAAEPSQYQWLREQAPLPHATNATLMLSNVAFSAVGAYAVAVTNLPAAWGAVSTHALLTVVLPPLDTAVVSGQDASFAVQVRSPAPVRYEWLFSGSPLPDQTNATLVIPAAQPSDEGIYTVVMFDATDVAAAYPAALDVVMPPTLSEPRLQADGQFEMLLRGEPGARYTIEATPRLPAAPLDWSTVQTVLYTGEALTIREQVPPGSHQRFYRARQVP